jgi:hypothetical protein
VRLVLVAGNDKNGNLNSLPEKANFISVREVNPPGILH